MTVEGDTGQGPWRADSANEPIRLTFALSPQRVGVLDPHEIFRRGLVACLRDDPSIAVVVDAARGPLGVEVDVCVASADAASSAPVGVPVIICSDSPNSEGLSKGVCVRGVLSRTSLTPEQLVLAVHAAAAGLEVAAGAVDDHLPLDARAIAVLQLLAEGARTRQIALDLGYSERTVKSILADAQTELAARTPAQAVATAIRRGLL